MTDPLQQAREALHGLIEAVDQATAANEAIGFTPDNFPRGAAMDRARSALQALPESLGERVTLCRATTKNFTGHWNVGGPPDIEEGHPWAKGVSYEVREALLLPDPSPKGAEDA